MGRSQASAAGVQAAGVQAAELPRQWRAAAAEGTVGGCGRAAGVLGGRLPGGILGSRLATGS